MSNDVTGFSVGSASLDSLQGLGDVLEVGVLIVDTELVVRGWNRWLAAATGMEAAEVIGRPLLTLFPTLAGDPAEAAVRRAVAGGATVWAQQFHGFLLPMAPPTGHEDAVQMQQSARILPLLRGGTPTGALVLIEDVTERVARERALREALKRAEVASQAKSDFLASMSHELRTPLAAIVGYMDLLEGDMVGPVESLQKEYFRRVKNAARHLISIIEEILTFSRIEAGKESVLPAQLDAVELACDVHQLFEPQAQEKQLELALVIPETAAPMHTDATKLRQILINLVGNAVKFTDAGRVCLALEVTADRIVFTVTDTGPGIAPDDAERVFDPFTQLDQSRKRLKGGTGLGLPVSRRLAHLLGGDLTLESAPGAGCTFAVSLPSRIAADSARAPGDARASQPALHH